MANVDVSRVYPPHFPDLINRWKKTATTPYKGASILEDGVNMRFGANNGSLDIQFHLFRDTQKVEVILWAIDAGHTVTWTMPMDDVPSDSSVAYERFVRQAEETLEDAFARRHKRFFQAEWEHFTALFSPGNQAF